MADISDIEFSPLPFDSLVIDEEKKQVAIALAESRVDRTGRPALNDIIIGKGLGVIFLLQYGPISTTYIRGFFNMLKSETVAILVSERR